jgi:imidazolonepropionase-like amidohydrolase
MAERGTYLVPTLSTYYALAKHGRELGFPDEGLHKLQDVLSGGTRSLEIARAAGVKMAFGTDLLGELQTYQSGEFGIRAEVLTPLEIIRSATTTAAEVVGRQGRLGTVAQGAYADLIAIDGNPLEDIKLLQDDGAHVSLVIKGGRVVKNLAGTQS